jgi:hypothetical protein
MPISCHIFQQIERYIYSTIARLIATQRQLAVHTARRPSPKRRNASAVTVTVQVLLVVVVFDTDGYTLSSH